MSNKALFSVALAASLALAGCGTAPVGSLATAPIKPAGQAATASSIVTTIRHEAAAPTVSTSAAAKAPAAAASLLLVNSESELSDEALAEDAENEGYSVMAADSKLEDKFGKTGIVRRTADGWALEVTTGLFKKTKTTYALSGSAEVMADVAARENKKASIKGTVDGEHVVTITTFKKSLDLGVLTNWATKGKIVGIAIDKASGKALAGVTVQATSAEGYVFKSVTEDDGRFELKSLTPGKYGMAVVKGGYLSIGGASVEVKSRKKLDLTAKLIAEPAPDTSASGAAN